MHELLPKKEELIPIRENITTFYDCGFNTDFATLSFIAKLQIVNDIVRQSMLPEINSNPENEVETMIGNCHTATLLSISYLQSLGIGKNFRYVIGRKKAFDPEDLPSKHAVLLVDDDEGNTYEYDATPFAGYGFGVVKRVDENPFYEEYIPVEGEVKKLITEIRWFLYERANSLLTPEKVAHYEYVFELCTLNPALKGFASYGYKLLYDSPFKADCYAKRAIQIDPYVTLNPDKTKINYRKELLAKQVKLWQEEINSLGETTSDIKRKGMLASWIIQEQKRSNPELERYLTYNGRNIPLSFLTPRFFYEEGLNCVIIKASAYHVGVRGTIREAVLTRGNGAIGEYFTNIASPTKDTGIKPMLYSHTLGDAYERSMNGPADIFLIKEDAAKLHAKKTVLRNSLAQNILYKDVMWNDGEPIFWHPFVTNLVHCTDGPVEASLHYAIAYPEHQTMTRFMYPNPRLERARKR